MWFAYTGIDLVQYVKCHPNRADTAQSAHKMWWNGKDEESRNDVQTKDARKDQGEARLAADELEAQWSWNSASQRKRKCFCSSAAMTRASKWRNNKKSAFIWCVGLGYSNRGNDKRESFISSGFIETWNESFRIHSVRTEIRVRSRYAKLVVLCCCVTLYIFLLFRRIHRTATTSLTLAHTHKALRKL